MKYFFQMRPCCRNKEFSQKLYDHYQGDMNRMRQDKNFRDILQAWVLGHHFTDMWTERLLARVRQSYGGEAVDVERLASNGFLTQMVAEHLKGGGCDPRIVTRQQLLQDGVPLRCFQKARRSKPRGGFVNWMMKEEMERKKQGVMLSREEYRRWQKQKAAQWNELPMVRQALEVAEALAAHTSRELDEGDVESINDSEDERRQRALRCFVDVVGNDRTPFSSAAFEEQIRKQCGLSVDQPCPGFSRYGPMLRDRQLEGIFIADAGSIPKSERFEYCLPCPQAHPGLCAEADKDVLAVAKACDKALHTAMASQKPGSFVHLRMCAGVAWQRGTWVCFSHTRGSGPKLTIYACCTVPAKSRLLSIAGHLDGFDFMLGVSLLGCIMKDVDGPCR